MMFEGLDDYYFWEGIKDSFFKNKKKKFKTTGIQSLCSEYYNFGYDLGKVLTEQEYKELTTETFDYLTTMKESYTGTKMGETYESN